MRGLKKQIISALLASTAFMASVPSFAVKIPADVAGTRFEDPIQVLSALKIMIGDESGNFRPEDTIIRSEVTKMAIHSMGLEDAASSASGVTKFPDVPADHWANGYINVATTQGIIIGDDEGNFRPNDPISYAEAMAIMVRATGYEPSAESKGGFPSGYIVVGSENGLGKNVTGTTHDPISRGNVAYLTDNALSVNLMEQKGFGNNISYEVTDKTLLKDRLKVTKAEGQITAIESSSLTGSSNLTNGQIKIGDNIYDTAYNMNNLLGYNVTYYVRESKDGGEEVILAMPQKEKNSTLSISADLFGAITTRNSNKAIEYYKSETDSKVTTVELSPKATLIYNGKYNELTDELIDMEGKAGNLTLLDTDRDSKYDIVFVTEYENMVVEEVTQSGKIIDKYGLPTLKLDEDVDYRITKGAETIKVSDLKEYDVLSVAASLDNELFDIIVTNEKVEGKVTGSDDKGFFIDNKHYKVANNYTQTINIGVEGTFYLDVEGKIAALDTTSQLSSNYAYLMRAYAAVDADEKVTFKVFTKEGKEMVLEATEKIRFNGVGGKKAADVVTSLNDEAGSTPKQLITYSLNSDGKLTALNTAKDNTSTGEANENVFTKNYVLSNAVYNEKLSKVGNVKIDDETIIFNIPDDSTDYSIAKKDMFEDEQKYNVVVYDRGEDFVAKVIIVTNAAFSTNADSSVAVVQSIGITVNDDDEQTDVMFALVDGKEVQILADEPGILVKGQGDEAKQLENGDVIQYKTNAEGEIVNIRVLLDIKQKDTEMEASPVENLDIVYGKVVKKFPQSINVTVNGGEVKNFDLPKDINVYSVDSTKTKNNIVAATIGDIQAYDADENNRVLVKLYKDVVQEVVIIK